MQHGKQYNIDEFDLRNIDSSCLSTLGYDYCTRYKVLPLKCEKGRLWVAMQDATDINLIKNLADITGMFIMPVIADLADIRMHTNHLLAPEAISKIASQFLVDTKLDKQPDTLTPEILAEISSAPAVRFVDSVIEAGILNRASDIHIEPFEGKLRTRYRLDGRLSTHSYLDISLLANAISRLKIMGSMDISEKRLPQDGRFTLGFGLEDIEFRISILPTAFGEKAAIRLLYGTTGRIPKTELGFLQNDINAVSELFNLSHGAVFITGPTGSGKSTTLNSFMADLDSERHNIVTVEDPVENPIPGVNHVGVDRAAGFTFADALRYILRQDPDIIMIGEIRDEETAKIAIQAALTGHLVLSTLHTNDAVGVLERLLDMGIEPYLIAASLAGVVSQRLVRKICETCIAPAALTTQQANLLNIATDTKVFAGKGCRACADTGYRGRIAVYEYIVISNGMRKEISANPDKFAEKMRSSNSILSSAVDHMKAGNTTAEEILLLG